MTSPSGYDGAGLALNCEDLCAACAPDGEDWV